MEPDFSKTFADHFPTVDPGLEPDDPTVDPKPGVDNSRVGMIIAIVSISVVVVAAIAVGVILVIKKKRTVES